MTEPMRQSLQALPTAIEKLYTHFLLRDLVYVAAGGLILTTSIYAVKGDLVFCNIGFMFGLGYLLASYHTSLPRFVRE